MIDLLGARNMDSKKTIDFLNKRKELVKKMTNVYKYFNPSRHDDIDPIGIILVQDTIFFYCEPKADLFEEQAKNDFLIHENDWLVSIIPEGLNLGLPFRGAVSYGEFYVDRESPAILGPAVNDAAEWYEKANWLGLILTPKMTLIRELAEEKGGYLNNPIFSKRYSVPMSRGGANNLDAVNWPIYGFLAEETQEFMRQMEDASKIIDTLLKLINESDKYGIYGREWYINKFIALCGDGAPAQKYINTLNFFDAFRANFTELNKGSVENKP